MPKSLENHKKNQEVGFLCSLFCDTTLATKYTNKILQVFPAQLQKFEPFPLVIQHQKQKFPKIQHNQ
jgi:hypothetical protein